MKLTKFSPKWSDKIRGLYAQAHELIKGDADPYDLKPIMFEIVNQVFSEMERAVLQESDAVTFMGRRLEKNYLFCEPCFLSLFRPLFVRLVSLPQP